MNASQKLTPFRSGQKLPAEALNHIVEFVKRMFVQGKGIEIKRIGDQLSIEATGQPIPRVGTSEGSPTAPSSKGRYKCPVVYSLPAVPTAADTYQMVYWTSEDEPHEEGEGFQEGTGDNTVWWTRTDLTRWYPMTYSELDGEPGETELE